MKLRKVLIVPKKSTYQIQAVEHKEANFLKLLEEGHSSVTKVKLAHEEHMETLQHLLWALDQRGVEHREVVRADLEGRIKGVDMVVNYELPDDPENYVHRIGRTGRAGANGLAFSLVSDRDVDALSRVEGYLKHKVNVDFVEEDKLPKEFKAMQSDRSQKEEAQQVSN